MNSSFHTPYPIGKAYLPQKKSLPQVLLEEQAGMFRFRRALYEDEKIIFTEKKVIKFFDEAITQFDLYIKPDKTYSSRE